MVLLLFSFMSLASATNSNCEIGLEFDRPVMARWSPRFAGPDVVRDAFRRLDPVATYELLLVNADSATGAKARDGAILGSHPGLDLVNRVDNQTAGVYELPYALSAWRGLPRHLERLVLERGSEFDTLVLIDPSLPGVTELEVPKTLHRTSSDIRDLVLALADSPLAHVIARNRCFFEMKQLRDLPITAEFHAHEMSAEEFERTMARLENFDPECTGDFVPRRRPGAGRARFQVGHLRPPRLLHVLAIEPSLTLTGIE